MSLIPAEKFEVCKIACTLAAEVLDVTSYGPLSQDFAIRKQLRSAAMSVVANLSEGYDRDSHREFIRFLNISRASLNELRTHMRIIENSKTLTFPGYKRLEKEYTNLSQKLLNLIKSRRNLLKTVS